MNKNKPVLEEAWRYFLSQQRIPLETVYHYTDERALLNIVATKRMWATDLRFMNDDAEIEYGRQILEEALYAAGVRERHAERRFWLAMMAAQLRALTRTSNWYSISVSQKMDFAGQWSTYGYGGTGFMLGWSIDTLPPEIPIHIEVVYDRQRQMKLARELIEIHLGRLRPKKTLTRGRGRELAGRVAGSLGNFLNIMLFNFKGDGWAAENEIRYVYQGLSGRAPAGTVIKLRPAGPIEKPYVESDFSLVPFRIVVAGPNASVESALRVRRALDDNGYATTPMYRSAVDL